jgi:hypothetical protein
MLSTNDLKKGDKIKLANGWNAEIMDNKKGNIRLAEVYGVYTEIGSVYAWHIVHCEREGKIFPITLSPKQIKTRNSLEKVGL